MNNLEEIAARLARTWGKSTLAEFRLEAEREANGTLFESLRVEGGRRLVIVLCMTDVDQIAEVERALDMVDGPTEDWNTLTLSDVVMRTAVGPGLSFECLRDEYGRRSAVILTAADPRSIQILERVFSLPT